MEAVAEGLWGLAEDHERRGEVGKAVKCLEAICQSQVSFLPMVEVKTRLRVAQLLLDHTHNLNHAKVHLERAHLLLKSIPSCFDLKCRAHALLSHCYHLIGALPPQKHILNRALDLVRTSGDGGWEACMWSCSFNSQLANALTIEGDYQASLAALEDGFATATQMSYPELQMFFATSMLHVHLLQWQDTSLVQRAVLRCSEVWESIPLDKVHGDVDQKDLRTLPHSRRIKGHQVYWDAAVKKALQMINGQNAELSKVVLARSTRVLTDADIDPIILLACLQIEGQNAYQFCIQPAGGPAFIKNTAHHMRQIFNLSYQFSHFSKLLQ